MSEDKKLFSEYDKPKPLSEHLAQKKREQEQNNPFENWNLEEQERFMTIDAKKSWAESAIDGIVGSIAGTIHGLGEDGRGFKYDGAAFAARNLLELSKILKHWSTIARQEGALWALVHHERFPEKQWCELEPQSGDEESGMSVVLGAKRIEDELRRLTQLRGNETIIITKQLQHDQKHIASLNGPLGKWQPWLLSVLESLDESFATVKECGRHPKWLSMFLAPTLRIACTSSWNIAAFPSYWRTLRGYDM